MALMRSVEEYGLEVPKVPTTVRYNNHSLF